LSQLPITDYPLPALSVLSFSGIGITSYQLVKINIKQPKRASGRIFQFLDSTFSITVQPQRGLFEYKKIVWE
jgi:hypothetical protein